MDVDSISPGADFVQYIQDSIAACGVVLVLIGHDWLRRGAGDVNLLEDPQDFVRLELSVALGSNVPIIPILVERTVMPSPEDMPEDLRSLTRRNALELENSRWEFDVSRLIKAIEPLVGTPAGPPPPRAAVPGSAPPAAPPAPPAGPKRGRLGVAIAAGVAVVVGVSLFLLLGRSSPINLSSSLQGVAPEPLALKLARATFTADETPAGFSAPTIRVISARLPGLVLTLHANFPGPDATDEVFFNVFDSPAHARAVFHPIVGLAGYQMTGTFKADGFADTTRCVTQHRPSSASVSESDSTVCAVLGDRIIVQAAATESTSSGKATKDRLLGLLKAAVRHVKRVASSTKGPAPRLQPVDAQKLVEARLDPALLPFELSGPTTNTIPPTTGAPSGLQQRQTMTFTRPDRADFEDYIFFWVFNSDAEAKSWYDTDLAPSGTNLVSSVDASGFSEPIYCKALHRPPNPPTLEVGVSACITVVRNVVIESYTSSLTNKQAGSNDLTVTLARVGILHLFEIAPARQSA